MSKEQKHGNKVPLIVLLSVIVIFSIIVVFKGFFG
jgi:hypothetical protein